VAALRDARPRPFAEANGAYAPVVVSRNGSKGRRGTVGGFS
jgi:hypothetical protein